MDLDTNPQQIIPEFLTTLLKALQTQITALSKNLYIDVYLTEILLH
ncbi:MAG: hypothetical protein HC903_04710 [Methylacidiphilales bacterium]|nr:hypothetical protein [Candidatus Methylacidiphilales bacterium]NJR16839.1 hypothetical protein [Calothrix sp. CSU_2_0]